MKCKYLVMLLGMVISSGAIAQYNETIRSDRPGNSIVPYAIGRGIFQIQSGVDSYGSTNSTLDYNHSGILSNAVLRYGLTERLETYSMIEYRSETMTQNGIKSLQDGISAMDIGFRYHLLSGEGWIPNVALQVGARLPILSRSYEIKNLSSRITLATSHTLSKTFTLTTNWGAAGNGNNGSSTVFYTVNLSFPITSKLGSYVENYGTLEEGTLKTHFDAGLGYLVTSDLQLDIYGGYGSNQGTKDFFVSMGFSWRTKRKV